MLLHFEFSISKKWLSVLPGFGSIFIQFLSQIDRIMVISEEDDNEDVA